MARYELLINQKQPSCGGKSPTRCEIQIVETNDPIAYVQALEPDCELSMEHLENDTILISGERNGMWFRYEFTED